MYKRSEQTQRRIWDKVFKNGPGRICGSQPLKNLKGYRLLKQMISHSNFLKAAFHKFLFDPFLNTLPRLEPCQLSMLELSKSS